MIYAIKIDNLITNTIVVNKITQKVEIEVALGAELIDTAEVNVQIGDLWNGENWTRNVNGEQVVIDTTPVVERTVWEELDDAYREGVDSV